MVTAKAKTSVIRARVALPRRRVHSFQHGGLYDHIRKQKVKGKTSILNVFIARNQGKMCIIITYDNYRTKIAWQ